jgi:hypothetical protein
MPSGLQIAGRAGELRVGYHLAARFGAWRLAVSEDDVVVTVTALEPDAYWFTLPPDSIRLEIGAHCWVWRAVETVEDTRYRVLGDPEVD